MKGLKVSLVIMASALITMGLSGMAYAFHTGGVANCDGCHTMHGIYTGGTSVAGKGPSLLVGTDPSSTCLLCHGGLPTGSASIGGGPKIMTYPFPTGAAAPSNFNSGGDFAWLQKTYTVGTGTGATIENGQTHGHNIIAFDFGMQGDTDFPATSPGGSFDSTKLGCDSCHDPHGKYRRVGTNQSWTIGTPATLGASSLPISSSGSKGAAPTSTTAVGVYRLLAGQGYIQGGVGGTPIAFPGSPIAVATGNGSSEATAASATTGAGQFRVAYANYNGSGATTWGQWCGTCHSAMLSTSAATSHAHPVDVPLSTRGEDQIYNSYVSTGKTGGSSATSYLSLVPFMESTSDIGVLATHASSGATVVTTGPAANDQVSCPTCHRSHATGFKNMMRWNMVGEFITLADSAGTGIWPGTDNGASSTYNQGRTELEMRTAYYMRPATYFGPYQRSLCNKCHAQD